MKKYEYKILLWTRMFNELQIQLCVLGEQGWELVSTNVDESFTQCFLKREIE